jgi:hypothetical protein
MGASYQGGIAEQVSDTPSSVVFELGWLNSVAVLFGDSLRALRVHGSETAPAVKADIHGLSSLLLLHTYPRQQLLRDPLYSVFKKTTFGTDNKE